MNPILMTAFPSNPRWEELAGVVGSVCRFWEAPAPKFKDKKEE